MKSAAGGAIGVKALALDAVEKDFAGVRAVRDVSLRMEPGEVVGLVGANGSGKTTLVNLASGALPPTKGRVAIDGLDLTGAPSSRFARAGVVRTYQALRLFEGLSALDNVLVGAQRSIRPSLAAAWLRLPAFRRREAALREAAMAALEEVGMADFAPRAVGALSHGQRRRVELARAFAAEPTYLVLDEPGAGVDPDQLEGLVAMVRRRRQSGVGVLLVEHDTSLVEALSDRVLKMAEGSIAGDGGDTANPEGGR